MLATRRVSLSAVRCPAATRAPHRGATTPSDASRGPYSPTSVRIAAADALCRLGYYEAALPALIEALEHPLVMARGRAANVLDSQPPAAAPSLRPALAPLRQAIARFGDGLLAVQYRFPMERAVAPIEGSTDYYRWPD